MKGQIEQQADLNMQHRVFGAVIKEKIYPDTAVVSTHNNQLALQYEGRILSVNYKSKHALCRYLFDGPITYRKGTEQEDILGLEALLNMLENHFDIPFSKRLRSELMHSKQGFIHTYKNYNQRNHLIKQSMKFSRMPAQLNFFTWLQHMTETNEMDDLRYSESIVFEGHPTHPLSKTKLPLTDNEVRQYAPEFENTIPLKLMLLHKDVARPTAVDGDTQYILNRVVPEYRYRLKAYLESLKCSLSDYHVILVHPWQYMHTITKRFNTWIETGKLLPTPFEIPAKPTLSFRTMDLIGKDYHVKLPVNVQATSAVRTVGPVTTIDGPNLSYTLQDMMSSYDSLRVASEPYGIYANTGDDDARQLACIIRERPEITQQGVTLVTASLVNRNPVDEHIVVDSYLEWASDGVTRENILNFITAYAQALIKPLIAYIQDYGIALEAHMQNTVVHMGPDFQMDFIVRDLGGARIDLATLNEKIPNIAIHNTSLLAQDMTAVIAKFQHAVIQNQMAELILHFSQYEDVEEAELYAIVSRIVLQAIDAHKPHAQKLKEVLFGASITVKSLLRMRMDNKVKTYVNINLLNPLKEDDAWHI